VWLGGVVLLHGECEAQIVLRVGEVGPQLHRLLKLRHRLG